ncbi:hypothetical protein H8N03_22760 [Ramlibacter sp. USB13]|uniref:Entry exclusion lipoprotein TrbK n=1 Tax=Ramlibacter cellulosilyticus TaxID=2764187 RepID=A0A923MX64_9BURK|nr:hypothetical protein [Ramlibacter cellulosilyticus]MBC5785779.1 hypothetical protein [Ramlibacter cellulosilyticus]
MKYLALVLAACSLGFVIFQVRTAPPDGADPEAKVAFLKKCFRDPRACEAPPAARVRH